MLWNFNEDDFNNVQSFDVKECSMCCCKHDTPHDESVKFVIKASEENMKLAPFKYTS